MANYKIGDLITFTYPLPPETRAHKAHPTVLVLHPAWRRPQESGVPLLHGLAWHELSWDEQRLIRMVLDPFYEMGYRDALKKKNPNLYAELERLISTPGSKLAGAWQQQATASRNVKITTPLQFYQGIIRPWIKPRGWEPYRRYRPDKIRNSRVLTRASVITGEESLSKWKQEREKLIKKVAEVEKGAQTDAAKIQAAELGKQLEKATAMSQRRSVLSKASDFFKNMVGPRFGGFGR